MDNNNKNNRLEYTFRKFTIAKLEDLNSILNLPDFFTTTTISGALTKVDEQLGARISSLTRTSIEGEKLLVPSGRVEKQDGSGQEPLWKINLNIAPKEEMKNIIAKILDESREFRMQTDK